MRELLRKLLSDSVGLGFGTGSAIRGRAESPLWGETFHVRVQVKPGRAGCFYKQLLCSSETVSGADRCEGVCSARYSLLSEYSATCDLSPFSAA